MNIQDVIEKIDAHSREIEKLNNERRELDRADLPRDAHNRELNQIVSFLDKETKAREEKEEIVRAYNTMKDNIEAIRRISNIPTKDFYERDEKNKEIEALNPTSVLDCYEFEKEKDNMNDILKK